MGLVFRPRRQVPGPEPRPVVKHVPTFDARQLAALTRKQREVAGWLAAGLSRVAIARKLDRTEGAVSRIVGRILERAKNVKSSRRPPAFATVAPVVGFVPAVGHKRPDHPQKKSNAVPAGQPAK